PGGPGPLRRPPEPQDARATRGKRKEDGGVDQPVRIGVISDTHIPQRAKTIPPIVYQLFSGVALILHAGDLTTDDVIVQLEAIAPVYAVHANVDPPDLVRRLPKKREIHVGGVRIGLIHGDGPGRSTPERALAAFPGADCV